MDNTEALPSLTNDQLRQFWRKEGGKFHGPNVETGTMPESSLLPMLRRILCSEDRTLAPTRETAPALSDRHFEQQPDGTVTAVDPADREQRPAALSEQEAFNAVVSSHSVHIAPLKMAFDYWRAALEWADRERAITGEPVDGLRKYVEDFAAGSGWDRDSKEGAFEFVQRKCYAQGFEDARASPQAAPITGETSRDVAAEGGLREFEEWLNDRRGLPVSEVFHDVVAKFRTAHVTGEPVAASELGDHFDLIEAVLKGYPKSMARDDALNSMRLIRPAPITGEPVASTSPKEIWIYTAGGTLPYSEHPPMEMTAWQWTRYVVERAAPVTSRDVAAEVMPNALADADILQFERSNGWGGMTTEQAAIALARWVEGRVRAALVGVVAQPTETEGAMNRNFDAPDRRLIAMLKSLVDKGYKQADGGIGWNVRIKAARELIAELEAQSALIQPDKPWPRK